MKYIALEKKEHVTVLTINKPESLNALNSEVIAELDRAVDEVEADTACRVLIITGAGKAFVAGADIAEMKDKTVAQAIEFAKLGNGVFSKIENLRMPVIAAVNGFALGGGCELALSCDIRIASEKAKFGQPEVSLGITPGFGGTQRLARLVGASKAKEWIFTGKIQNAAEAEAIGLVSKVSAPGSLMSDALELAEKIAANKAFAVSQSKKAINRGLQCDINTGLAFECEAFGACFSTEDQKNAMTAFLKK